jgi:hypothetical protein
MSPEQLDALRPKPVPDARYATAETTVRFAYRTATNLEVVERIQALERAVVWLKEALVQQNAPPASQPVETETVHIPHESGKLKG